MPTPQAGESQDEFMGRCMSEQEGHFDDQDQAIAACFTAWRGDKAGQRAVVPNLVYLKSRGLWQQRVLVDNDLCDWFRDHIDSKGVVQEPILLFEKADIKPVEGGYLWTLSDFSVDRDQERIDPKGWDLSFYKRLPIVLWAHDYSRPAIGIASELQINADSLTGKVAFSSKEVDPFAAMIEGKVKEGIIKAGSVGFMSNKIELINEEGNPTRLIHRKQTLIEFSICNIPTNINAVMQPQLEISRSRTRHFIGDEYERILDRDPDKDIQLELSRSRAETATMGELLDNLGTIGTKTESYIAQLLKQDRRETSDLETLFSKQSEKD